MVLTISNQGWVAIPAELRKKIQLARWVKGGYCGLRWCACHCPGCEGFDQKGYGFLKEGPSLSATLKEDRTLEKKREQRFTKD